MLRKAALVVGFSAGAAIVALACKSYDTIYGDPYPSDAPDAPPPITDVYVPPIQVDAQPDARHDAEIDAPDTPFDATLDAREDAGFDAPDG